MTRLLAVIERDLKKFKRNPVVLAMSILMPLIYLIIIGNSFQGKLHALPLAYVSQDSGPHARRVLENLRALEAGPATIRLFSLKDQKEAVDGVKEGRYKAALVIPPDFSKRIVIRKRAEAGLFLDNTDGISSETIRNSVAGVFRFLGDEYVSIREKSEELSVRDIDLYSKVDYYQSLVPGVVIMAIFLGTLTTGAFNLVMDRFLGVDESYLLTPITKSHIVAGLILSGLLLTTVIAVFIFTVSIFITGIPFSRFIQQALPLLLVIILTTLGLLSMMFVVLGRIHHPRVVGILSGFLNVILFFPSGAVYPVASFPGWLKAFAKVNPEAYAVHALKTLLFKGSGLSAVAADIVFLLAFTALMLTTAILTFKRTL